MRSDSESNTRHIDDSRIRFELLPTAGLPFMSSPDAFLWYDLPVAFKAIGLAAALLVSAITPVSAIGAVLAAVPFIFDPVELADREFSLLELAILVGGAGIGVNALRTVVSERAYPELSRLVRPWPVTIGAAALLAAACISLVTLADERYRAASLREFRLVIVEPLLFFLACRWVLTDARARRFASIVLVATGAAVGAFAVGQVVLWSDGVVADGVRRATGPYPHPNNLALFLDRAALLGVGIALARPSFDRWVGAMAAVALVGVGVTFSRGAAMAVLVGLVLVLHARQKVRGIWVLGLAAATALAVLLLTVGDRVLDTGSTGASSTRWLIWQSSIEMALDHRVWGVGLDQFYTQYWPRYVDPAGWPERYTSHAHNLFLDVWLRLGILGLIAATAIGVAAGIDGFRILRARTSAGALELGALAALVTGFVHGMVDNGFFLPDIAVLTWFVIVLLERPSNEPSETRRDSAPTVGGA